VLSVRHGVRIAAVLWLVNRFTLMRGWIMTVVAVCVALGALTTTAVADAPAPVNDDYLKSLRLEDAHHRTPRQPTLDVQDTSAASVQADVLAPAGAGGGAEPTNCDGVNYGRTIWYDITPDQYGAVRLQSAGRDGVIALYEYDPHALNLGRRVACVNEPGVQDQLDAWLEKGKAYTVQLGGVDTGAGPAGGEVQFTEQFLDDRDQDKVLDAVDKCVGTRGLGRLKGCLPEVDVAPTIRWIFASGGVQVTKLSIADPDRVGGTVEARCCGRHFTHELHRGRVSLTKVFKTKPLPFGSTLTVTVTRPGAIAERFRWRIERAKGVSARQTTCLMPATGRPPKTGHECQ
jgi:hypothetical protein